MHLGDSEQRLNYLTVMHQSGDDTVVLDSECQVPVQKVRVMFFLFFPTNLEILKYGSGTHKRYFKP